MPAASDLKDPLSPRHGIDRRTALLGLAGCLVPGFLRADAPTIAPERGKTWTTPLRVLVWAEGIASKSLYPDDIDGTLADDLSKREGFRAKRARLSDADAGLGDAALDQSDVLIWFGRLKHDAVPDDRVRSVVERVRAGRLGLVSLHSAHSSKPFQALMGTNCEVNSWRLDGKPEKVEVKQADHPIAKGVTGFTIPRTAMFAEPFQVPTPEAVVFQSTFEGGQTFRSGLTWTIGKGRVFYFRPGHDGFPVYHHPTVRQIIANAATWVGRRS